MTGGAICDRRPARAARAIHTRKMISRRGMLPWTVVSAWLVGVATAFWHFELRPQHGFSAPGFLVTEDPRQRECARHWFQDLLRVSSAREPAAALTVVHVYRNGCDCNRFTEAHLAEIEARFRQQVRFIRV